MNNKIFVIIVIAIFPATIHAQVLLSPTVISSGGDYYECTTMSISWTLGELVVTTLQGDNMILTQGFQQPYDIGVGIKQNEMNWSISVYPNPVGDELRILFDIPLHGDYLIEIQDVTGRVIHQVVNKQIQPGETVILNTSRLLHGIYFLKVISTDNEQVQITSIRKI